MGSGYRIICGSFRLLHLLVETVNRNEEIPDDVATIKYKVKSMIIPYAIVDSGSNLSVITENFANN
ncbi:hypothetical protein RhiirA4_490693 [Rhizophagus irregularis]|uniref:Uncharacterized protein n=1 Tax=Rhizophagus irregularis TaxID=588596 RepID=A0A2I1HVU2_9GLOM|nr:hypothetical protein RhiirA4_490693 [Rhizophagus irregularis]